MHDLPVGRDGKEVPGQRLQGFHDVFQGQDVNLAAYLDRHAIEDGQRQRQHDPDRRTPTSR